MASVQIRLRIAYSNVVTLRAYTHNEHLETVLRTHMWEVAVSGQVFIDLCSRRISTPSHQTAPSLAVRYQHIINDSRPRKWRTLCAAAELNIRAAFPAPHHINPSCPAGGLAGRKTKLGGNFA